MYACVTPIVHSRPCIFTRNDLLPRCSYLARKKLVTYFDGLGMVAGRMVLCALLTPRLS